jgi:hypothetical protein
LVIFTLYNAAAFAIIATSTGGYMGIDKVYEAAAFKHGASSVSEGINWCFANGFPTQRAAFAFLKDPSCVNMEARGIYTDAIGTFSVRFR